MWAIIFSMYSNIRPLPVVKDKTYYLKAQTQSFCVIYYTNATHLMTVIFHISLFILRYSLQPRDYDSFPYITMKQYTNRDMYVWYFNLNATQQVIPGRHSNIILFCVSQPEYYYNLITKDYPQGTHKKNRFHIIYIIKTESHRCSQDHCYLFYTAKDKYRCTHVGILYIQIPWPPGALLWS